MFVARHPPKIVACKRCIELHVGDSDAQATSIVPTVYHRGNIMNFDSEFDDPLTDEEFGVLERFLSSNAVCDDAMGAVMLHGFLTAVISGPAFESGTSPSTIHVFDR